MQQYVPAGMKEDTNESPTNEKFSACPDSQVLPPCNALASKTAQPLKHPNKITPLTPSHLPKVNVFLLPLKSMMSRNNIFNILSGQEL